MQSNHSKANVSQGLSQNFTRFGLYYVKNLSGGPRTFMSLNCLEGLFLPKKKVLCHLGWINTISAGQS